MTGRVTPIYSGPHSERHPVARGVFENNVSPVTAL
jgi:hypothetical protein